MLDVPGSEQRTKLAIKIGCEGFHTQSLAAKLVVELHVLVRLHQVSAAEQPPEQLQPPREIHATSMQHTYM